MSASPTVGVAWFKGIIELFRSVGLDVAELFEDAGIDLHAINDTDARFPSERISRLWELAVARSGKPALGLAMPDRPHLGSFDVIVHIMMASSNLSSALDRLVRYLRIVSDAVQVSREREDGGYSVAVTLEGGGRPVPKARIEFAMLTALNLLRWLSGLRLTPIAVDFPYPTPADLQPYQMAFRCPLRFNATVHKLHFSDEDLRTPLATANTILATFNDKIADEQLSRLDGGRITQRAKSIIVRSLPDGDPMRADVAKQLCMSERTFQRRLHDEGTSFNEVVDAARRELADQYLRKQQVTVAQIAYLLGFSDQSTFFRSCRRWFGTSPGEYRKQLMRAHGQGS